MSEKRLAVRAVVAFLALPGMVAFAVPLLVLRPAITAAGLAPAGFAPVVLGCVILLWCVHDFYVAGRGTLAPWSPPSRLVIIGLYRFSRNPMYVGVLLILCGWAIAFRSSSSACTRRAWPWCFTSG